MILRDRIVATTRVVTGTDIYGNEVYGDVTAGPYPAEVRPLGSVENVTADRTQVVTRYRVFVPADAQVTASSAITWRGDSYEVTGDVEPWTIGGRVHHLELLVKRVTG